MDPYRYKAPREVAESERLFQRDLRALRVVDDERDLRPVVLRREDVDRVHGDPRAGEAPGDLRELTGAVHQLQVQDVVQLELQAARASAFSVVCTSDVTTRRNELSCFDSLAIARMFTAAPARASV